MPRVVRWHVLHKVVVHTLQRHCRIPARNVVSPWQCIEALLEHASVVKLGLGGRTLASGMYLNPASCVAPFLFLYRSPPHSNTHTLCMCVGNKLEHGQVH